MSFTSEWDQAVANWEGNAWKFPMRRAREFYLTKNEHPGGALFRRSSTLVNSVFVEELSSDFGFAIGTDVGYGAAWEKGFSKVIGGEERFFEPRPWLAPAHSDTEDDIRKLLEDELGKALASSFSDRTIVLS